MPVNCTHDFTHKKVQTKIPSYLLIYLKINKFNTLIQLFLAFSPQLVEYFAEIQSCLEKEGSYGATIIPNTIV